MTSGSAIPFSKMNGLGNDFAVLDTRGLKLTISTEAVQRIAARGGPIGCDQVIALEASQQADVFMRIWNADGGEVEACGNGARCVAGLMAAELHRTQITIETAAALLGAQVNGDGTVTIDMGRPRFGWDEIPLSKEFHDTRQIELQVGPIDNPGLNSPSVANIGNPHCIFWVDIAEAHDLAAIGSVLEHHPLFPEHANISIAQVTGEDSLILRVWERGAGLTQACGTAACAAAVAAARKGLTGRNVTVELPGGALQIRWRKSDDHILMTGPFELDCSGTLDPLTLALERANA